MEIWKSLKSFDLYEVSSEWNVRVKRKNWYRIIKKRSDKDWYEIVDIWDFRKTCRVHRLVAEVFLENTEKKEQINHKNWIKNDNKLDNLEWCTNWENQKHKYRVLLQKHPMKWKFWKLNPRSKKVWQYSESGKLIKEWDSANDIIRELNINQHGVTCRCRWETKSLYKWFMWKYI